MAGMLSSCCLKFLRSDLPSILKSVKCSWSRKYSKDAIPAKEVYGNYQRGYEVTNDGSKVVGFWLLGCSGMTSVAVLLGGVTRLTESGLSMVTWKFFGEKKPTNKIEWELEFFKYKQFPEFKMLNSSMKIEDFKRIYLMEYYHRLWGRAIGLYFLIPAVYFWKRGYIDYAANRRIILCALLIGAQGLMGWHMVKSGLEDRFKDLNDVPRVSQYRLAIHLTLALILHALCLSTALSKLIPARKLNVTSSKTLYFQRMALVVKGFIILTAVSGAFVAGLDAGLIYNTFPKMGNEWMPYEVLVEKPIVKNFTGNPASVQFSHRLLGMLTLASISLLYLIGKRTSLPKRAYWALNTLTIMAWVQATLGVSTLLNHVPISIAAAHQSGSLLLLSIIVWLNHELKPIKYLPK